MVITSRTCDHEGPYSKGQGNRRVSREQTSVCLEINKRPTVCGLRIFTKVTVTYIPFISGKENAMRCAFQVAVSLSVGVGAT